MQVQSLSQEDPLEKKMTTHSDIAWKVPYVEKLGRLCVQGVTKIWTQLNTHTHTLFSIRAARIYIPTNIGHALMSSLLPFPLP